MGCEPGQGTPTDPPEGARPLQVPVQTPEEEAPGEAAAAAAAAALARSST